MPCEQTGASRDGAGATSDGTGTADQAGLRLLTGPVDEAMVLARASLESAKPETRARAAGGAAAGLLLGCESAPDLAALRTAAAAATGSEAASATRAFLCLSAAALASGHFDRADEAAKDAGLVAPVNCRRLRVLCDMAAAGAAIARGRSAQAKTLMPPAEELLRSIDPIMDGTLAAFLGGAAYIWSEEYGQARVLLEEIERRNRAARTVGALPAVLLMVGLLEQRLCRWQAAAEAGAEAVRLARELGQSRIALLSAALLAVVEAVQGRAAACRVRSIELLESATDMPQVRSVALIALGLLELGEGNFERSAYWYEVVAGSHTSRGDPQPAVSMWQADLADAYIGMGHPERAHQLLAGLDSVSSSVGNERGVSAVIRSRASLAEDEVEAGALFTEALAHYRGPAWRFARARTEMAWGERLMRRGEPDAAAPALRAALDEFEEQGARGWAARAATLLEQAGAGPVHQRHPVPVLTPAEVRVAMAAAFGSGVEHIAAGLFMPVADTEQNLRSAMEKLGTTDPAHLAPLMGRLAQARLVPVSPPSAGGAGGQGGPAGGSPFSSGPGGDAPSGSDESATPGQGGSRTGRPAPDGISASISIRLLGAFSVRHDLEPFELHDGVTAKAVKIVALAGKVPAEVLIEDLWPETEPSLGRARLRSLMARLRRQGPPLLLRQGSWILLAPEVTVDVDDFERLAHEAQIAASAGDEAAGVLASRALESYGGELLPADRDLDVTVAPRERLGRRYLAVLHVAIDDACRRDMPEFAVRLLEDALVIDPYDEDLYLRAAGILADAGHRGQALGLLRRAERALAELGVPSTATSEFRVRLLGDRPTTSG